MTEAVDGDRSFEELVSAGRFAEAEGLCRRILALQPKRAETLNNLANLLEELGRLPEAEAAYRQSIDARPDFAAAHYNLGLMLQGQRRLDEAAAAYRRALSLQPGLVQAHNNLGAVLRDLGRLDDALAAFEAAVRLRPDYADAQFNQAMCHLQAGDYGRGWAQYEWRWRMRQSQPVRRDFSQPLWLGRESLAGRTILLHAEQGYGDTLQFCRYAPKVAALGATVILEVQPGLERLVGRLDGVSRVVSQANSTPAADWRAPLMSLPLAMNTRLETVPAEMPYLTAEPEAAARWARRLGRPAGLRVGLVWAGATRPDQPLAAAVDARRSLPLEAFAAFADIQGVEIISLQKGPAAAQLRQADQDGWMGPPIADYTAELDDFADTAALVANLDLVISCDTSVAHLAGAMGKPVWILNRFDSCWRWLADRDDSPWYPTARLFRQTKPGDWDDVLARVASALAELAS